MTSENTLTGRLGRHVVGSTLVARLANWNVSTSAGGSEWGDSDSNGYTSRSSGRRDATFNTEGKYSTSSEQFDVFKAGDIVASILWMNITTLYWDFPRSLCNAFSLTVDVNTEDVIGWTAGWGADGVFYAPGEAGATSRTFPS